MKKITLDELERKYKSDDYLKLYSKVMSLIGDNKLKPILASGKNGKKPALYKSYWIVEEQVDNSEYIEELSYSYAPCISTDYYHAHINEYKEDRQWVLKLNEYMLHRRKELDEPQSMNERSFAIWNREKFLKEEQGKKILKRCGVSIEMLNIYETTEPLAYYAHTKEIPQNMLIVENKDTFYSMRRRLMFYSNEIMGMKIGTLIYGAGKSVFRSFKDFDLCVEPHMNDKSNTLYYFGDMDYEGILIYEKFAEAFKKDGVIVPFCSGYEKMVELALGIGMEQLPDMKQAQNCNIKGNFFGHFMEKHAKIMREILEKGKYIPQEILSEKDF